MTQPPRIDEVVGYLRVHGWTVTSSWRNATVWSRDEFDVLVPPSDEMADTAMRLRELIRCVADAEGRSTRGVLRDITMPAVDVVSYRAHDLTGSVALPAGVRMVRATRDLVAACAREALGHPQPAQGVAVPEAVRTLLDSSLLTLSDEVFGLDIALPIEDGSDDPLGRKTALRVLHNSTTVSFAARSADVDSFDQVFRDGVSDDVCVALSELAGQDRITAFELGFRWSRLAPLAEAAVHFPEGAGERIRAGTEQARRALENSATAVGSAGVVRGPVIRLSDDESGERWRIAVRGVLEVDGVPSGRRRLVTVSLRDAHDYQAALTAHREGRLVRVSGTVKPDHGARGITAAEDGFIVIDPTQA
jgi:hypothetical protein